MLEQLVEAGASLYDISSTGISALHVSCEGRSDRLDKIRYLIELDEDIVNSRDNEKRTALTSASYYGHSRDAAELLVGYDKELLFSANKFNDLPIYIASRHGCKAHVEFFIQQGVDINSKGSQDRTPLHKAAADGFYSLVKLLTSCQGHRCQWLDSRGTCNWQQTRTRCKDSGKLTKR